MGISENYNGAALHPIDFIDISTGQLVAEVMDPNITTINPVNKLCPKSDILATGSSSDESDDDMFEGKKNSKSKKSLFKINLAKHQGQALVKPVYVNKNLSVDVAVLCSLLEGYPEAVFCLSTPFDFFYSADC